MLKILRWMGLGLWVALGVAATPAYAGFGSQLFNGGFQQAGATPEAAAYWQSSSGGMWGGSVRSGWSQHDGDGYANLIKGAWGGFTYGGSWQTGGAVQGMGTYELSAWFLMDNVWYASNCFLKIEWYQDGQWLSSSSLALGPFTQGVWVKKILTAKAPRYANQAHVVLEAGGIGPWGALYMDVVNFGPVDPWVIRTGAVPNGGFWQGSWNVWGGASRTDWHQRDGDGYSTMIKGTWGGYSYGGLWATDPSLTCRSVPYEAAAWFYVDNGWTAATVQVSVEWYWRQYWVGTHTFTVTNLTQGQWVRNTFLVPACYHNNEDYVHVVVQASGVSASGALYVDAISLMEAVPVSNNRISNGGFEAGVYRVDTQALRWSGDGGGMWGSAARRNWKPYAGAFSGTLQGSWSGSTAGGWWQHSAVNPGVTYTASAQCFRETAWTATNVMLSITWYNSDVQPLSVNSVNLTGMPAEAWYLRSVSAVAPAQARYAIVALEASGIGPNGTFYLDEVKLQ